MDSTHRVARGAGLVFLGRLGALIEILTVFLFTRLYGGDAFGVFVLFWGYIILLAVMCDAGMTMALQRFIPGEEDTDHVHRIARLAFLIPISIATVIALLLTIFADALAPLVNSAASNHEIALSIRIYAWALPIWCMVEAVTAAVRARHAFGPEIRIRIFYEQALRLVGGLAFYYMGFGMLGLFVSHVLALIVVAASAIRLLGRYYDLKTLISPPRGRKGDLPNLLRFGLSMVLPTMSNKVHGQLPLMVLNAMIPGSAGAVAAAVYAVARKIVSALSVIRESFSYVMAPVTAAGERTGGSGDLRRLYKFASMLMAGLFMPAATLVLIFRDNLMHVAGPDFRGDMLEVGAGVITILAAGRFLEVLAGPAVAVISMVGRYRLPMLNALAGIIGTIILLFVLVPVFGIQGGAMAVTVGVNITTYAALYQLWRLRGVRPYDARHLVFLGVSATFSCLIFVIETFVEPYGLHAKIAVGVVCGVLAIFLLVRLAFAAYDDKPVDKSVKAL